MIFIRSAQAILSAHPLLPYSYHLFTQLSLQAFETAHSDMTTIMNSSAQIPDVISTIVTLVLKGSADDIQSMFQSSIDDLQVLSKKCRDAAHESEAAFKGISDLAQVPVPPCWFGQLQAY